MASTTATTGLRCTAFRPMHRATLRGFASIEHGSGLILADCPAHERDGRSWVMPPGKPMIDANGVVMREAETGKARYTAVVTFVNDTIRRRWSDAAADAVRRDFPAAFEPPPLPAARPTAASRPARGHDDDLVDDAIPF